MSGEWSGGFSAGIATGAAMGRNQAEGETRYVTNTVYESDLNAEGQLVMAYAALEAQTTVRNSILDALREVAPQHPLAAASVSPSEGVLGPVAAKIYDEVHDRIVATGLDTNQELRRRCPGLTRHRDERRAEEAKAAAKAEADRLKAEAKAANPGIFKRLFG